ncbi:hypothetical protein C8J56DRAFT_979369 [Mycena floridula]|nr:hypothetical protein C8J56DRAFT_979369 [Mycena floridula]
MFGCRRLTSFRYVLRISSLNLLIIPPVGGALRINPFAPYVPCHRVIASNLYIGGFLGEWGKEGKTKTQVPRKLKLLESEGVQFSDAGFLCKPEDTLLKS